MSSLVKTPMHDPHCTLRMASNSRLSKLGDDDEYVFSWQTLAGWDFTIGSLEAAQNKVASINTGLREALLEAKELEKEEKRSTTHC